MQRVRLPVSFDEVIAGVFRSRASLYQRPRDGLPRRGKLLATRALIARDRSTLGACSIMLS